MEVININAYYIYGELYHHGIKGQRWGIRRFQNGDGSLTSAGKKRYMDNPQVQKTKSDYDAAKVRFNQAHYEIATLPTAKSAREFKAATKNLQKSDFIYKTEKEVARLAEKGVTFKNKSKHRIKLEEKYKEMGLTDEQAQAAANNRIRTEKILAASAGVTVAACAAYYAHSKYKDKVDQIIKAGETMQRIEMADTKGKIHNVFYSSKGKHDNTRYKNMLSAQRQQQTGKAYMMKLTAMKDIKVASKDNAAKAFGDLYKNDPNFRSNVEKIVYKNIRGDNLVNNANKFSSRNIRKMYENFNCNIPKRTNGYGEVYEQFFNKLKSDGYGAIQDINDMKFSGYNARNPLIFFGDSSSKMLTSSYQQISRNMSNAAQMEFIKARIEMLSNEYLKEIGLTSAAGLTAAATVTYVSDPVDHVN